MTTANLPSAKEMALIGLNEQQRQAVTTVQGPVLIVAGPGSGKTRVITQRIAYLISHGLTPPHGIAAVTFTNKAAAEMAARIEKAGIVHQGSYIGTFHRLCGHMLRQHGDHIGIRQNYSVYDREDQNSVAGRALELAQIDKKRFKADAIINHISLAKSRLIDPITFQQKAAASSNLTEFTAGIVYPIYQDLLTEANAIDYDDMLVYAVRLLRSSPEVQGIYHQRFHHLMVDEFQDTNRAQMELTRLLTGPRQNLCIVGDPDQSIYGWRAAEVDNILRFKEQYPEAAEIHLGNNYRSTPQIVAAAGQLIAHNQSRIPNRIFTENPAGDLVQVTCAQNASDEAQIIFDYLADLRERYEYPWRRLAVMYRGNSQSRALEETCMRRGVPYRIFGGVQFYQRREVKDVLAYLRILANPADTAALQRIINLPPRGIGAKTVSKITQHANRHECSLMQAVHAIAQPDLQQVWQAEAEDQDLGKRAITAISRFNDLVESLQSTYRYATVPELFDAALELTHMRAYIDRGDNPQERWSNIMELRNLASEFNTFATADEGLAAFLMHTAVSSEEADPDDSQGLLTLTTLHSAKGLEFVAVAIAGVSEGIIPSPFADDPEEERRLLYVGITRAQKHLLMVANLHHFNHDVEPSRFLSEIDDLEWLDW